MARRPRVLAPGLLYHVVARGNQRQQTFLTDLDYRAYLGRLAAYRNRYAVLVFAYCLMPNHVHLLVQTSEPPLSTFMQGLQQSYTQWFNASRPASSSTAMSSVRRATAPAGRPAGCSIRAA